MSALVERFTDAQVEEIIDRVVPLIAEEAYYPFFRGVLRLRAEAATSSADFSSFVATLLRTMTPDIQQEALAT